MLPNNTAIATIKVIVPPPYPITGQLRLEAGDDIFAVDGNYFSSVGEFGDYIASMKPGSNVRLDYFMASRNKQAVSGMFPVAGPNGFPTENALHYGKIFTSAISICEKIECLGGATEWLSVIGLGVELMGVLQEQQTKSNAAHSMKSPYKSQC
jgi:hypothetical protein